MLTKIKVLLNITDSSQDELLSLYLDIVKQKVLNYCNRDDIPTELELVVVEMTAKQFKSRGGRVVQSVKRGDTQTNYASESEGENLLTNYQVQLDKFKISSGKKVRFI